MWEILKLSLERIDFAGNINFTFLRIEVFGEHGIEYLDFIIHKVNTLLYQAWLQIRIPGVYIYDQVQFTYV